MIASLWISRSRANDPATNIDCQERGQLTEKLRTNSHARPHKPDQGV